MSNITKETDVNDVPVYQIVSGTVLDQKQAEKYSAASAPLSSKAGLEIVASGSPELMEGQWPHKGEMTHIIKFRSMNDMKKFWNSDEYQEVKKLRKDAIDIDFIIALSAVE